MSVHEDKLELASCKVQRWQQIKASLQNYDYPTFINAYKSSKNALVLDVRTKEEFQLNHIPGAINLDYLSNCLADDLEKLDSSKSYFIYCRTGRRSLRVCVILKNLGFDQVYNLENGIANV